MPPVLLAGLLYLGSGLGLNLARVIRDGGVKPSGLPRSEWPWLLGAVFFGGVLGPVALMFGLVSTSGATASLLLNLEAVLSKLLKSHDLEFLQLFVASPHVFISRKKRRTSRIDFRIAL